MLQHNKYDYDVALSRAGYPGTYLIISQYPVYTLREIASGYALDLITVNGRKPWIC